MKTLIEMKKVYCFNRFVLFVMVLSLATTFTSCSNDDDEDIPVYSLKDVEGNYLGKMTTESAPVIPTENAGESEEPVGIEVNAEVKDNEIAINKFPVDDLIKSIIEDPDQAEIIIKAIGDINYKIPYTATFNENKDNILLQLQPEPLEIKFDPSTQLTANEKEATEITVIVTVQADEKGDFAYNGKTFLRNLNLETIIPVDDSVRLLSQFVEAMELNCKRDINFMYLLEGKPVPDYATFARFRSIHFAPCAKRILAEMSNLLYELGEISGKTITKNRQSYCRI